MVLTARPVNELALPATLAHSPESLEVFALLAADVWSQGNGRQISAFEVRPYPPIPIKHAPGSPLVCAAAAADEREVAGGQLSCIDPLAAMPAHFGDDPESSVR